MFRHVTDRPTVVLMPLHCGLYQRTIKTRSDDETPWDTTTSRCLNLRPQFVACFEVDFSRFAAAIFAP